MRTHDVICPQSHTRERIGCICDRDGEALVVLRCSRFEPRADVECCESCRAQLDPRLTASR